MEFAGYAIVTDLSDRVAVWHTPCDRWVNAPAAVPMTDNGAPLDQLVAIARTHQCALAPADSS